MAAKVQKHIISEKNVYTLNKGTGFDQIKTIIGIVHEAGMQNFIYYGGLEELKSVEVSVVDSKNKKTKLSKSAIVKSDYFSDEFYSGYKQLSINFPAEEGIVGGKYIEKSHIRNQELMCLTALFFSDYWDVLEDTISNTIVVPKTHQLLFSKNDFDNIPRLTMDSIVNENDVVYTFKYLGSGIVQAANAKIKSNKHYGLRVLILPKTEKNPYTYFNTWYLSLLQGNHMGAAGKQLCDSLTRGITSRDSIVKVIFDYVKTSIKYLSVENGINAFKPRMADDVLYNKQGDCKDMGYLLKEMLQYKKIDAEIALSATLSHPFALDFPTLSSANHAICIARISNKYYYLDATEKLCNYKKPSTQIQGTTALICSKNGASSEKIPAATADQNKSKIEFTITSTGDRLEGKLKAVYKGYSKTNMESGLLLFSKNKAISIFKKEMENSLMELNNIQIINSEDSLVFVANIIVSASILSEIENRLYIQNSFLPSLHNFPMELDTTIKYTTYMRIHNEVKMEINLSNYDLLKSNNKKIEKIVDSKDGITYSIETTLAKNKIVTKQIYQNDHLILTPDILPTYNKINNTIKQHYFHATIIPL